MTETINITLDGENDNPELPEVVKDLVNQELASRGYPFPDYDDIFHEGVQYGYNFGIRHIADLNTFIEKQKETIKILEAANECLKSQIH